MTMKKPKVDTPRAGSWVEEIKKPLPARLKPPVGHPGMFQLLNWVRISDVKR